MVNRKRSKCSRRSRRGRKLRERPISKYRRRTAYRRRSNRRRKSSRKRNLKGGAFNEGDVVTTPVGEELGVRYQVESCDDNTCTVCLFLGAEGNSDSCFNVALAELELAPHDPAPPPAHPRPQLTPRPAAAFARPAPAPFNVGDVVSTWVAGRIGRRYQVKSCDGDTCTVWLFPRTEGDEEELLEVPCDNMRIVTGTT